MPDFAYSDLKPYLDSLVPERHAELQKMEEYAAENSFPIVGPASGQLCYLLARMSGAKRICELGSGYGYSTAWFASAVRDNGSGGVVKHIVWDQELSDMARVHLKAMGFCDCTDCNCSCTRIDYRVGEAVEALKNDDSGPYDIIFCDIDKQGYPDMLPIAMDHMKPGSILIVDNMIWSGRVMDDSEQDDDTLAIRKLTALVCESDRWDAMIAPIRDGLLIARFRG